MKRMTVEKSAVRQFLMGIAGVILLVGALDILWMHRITSEPQTDQDGALTGRGNAMRRTDVIWGSVFLVTGAVVLGGAMVGLAVRRPVLVLDEDGLELRVAGPVKTAQIPWKDIVAVRSAHETPEDGGRPIAVLEVEVSETGWLPESTWGAERRGSTLVVDAGGWSVPPEEVAIHAEVMATAARRRSGDG